MFGQDLRVALEAKFECGPGGQVAARDAREAGTHLDPEQAKPVITSVLRARRALPSQWLPSLTTRRLQDG